jgi:hypothetical protein
MPLFKKKDEAAKLTDLQKADEKKLESHEKELVNVRPKWDQREDQAENIAMKLEAMEKIHRGFAVDSVPGNRLERTYGVFFDERKAALNKNLEEAITRRDDLTYQTSMEIHEIKKRTRGRLSIVASNFERFVSGIGNSNSITDELSKELTAAKKQAESMTDIAQLLSFVADFAEKIETMEFENIPLLQLDRIIKQALEYTPNRAISRK